MKRTLFFIAGALCFALIIFMAVTVRHRQVAPPPEVRHPARTPPPPAKPVTAGVIAIVIDDIGYNKTISENLGSLGVPVTGSIIPDLPFSLEAAAGLHERNIEIILHLPLEPHAKANLEPKTIMVAMDDATVRKTVDGFLRDISYAKGVSNHMGSLATEDPRIMGLVFAELKKHGVYFLDSFVTPRSVCREEAAKAGIRFARRDVFLDNESDAGYIRGQLSLLKQKARQRGFAIGIGHDRKKTLQVLKEELPRIASEGYRFVFLSELVR